MWPAILLQNRLLGAAVVLALAFGAGWHRGTTAERTSWETRNAALAVQRRAATAAAAAAAQALAEREAELAARLRRLEEDDRASPTAADPAMRRDAVRRLLAP